MSTSRIAGLVASMLATVALGACGGSEKEDAEQTVRDIAAAATDSDGDKFCDLVTQQFLEQTTGARGDKAKESCKKQIDSSKNADLEVTKITKTTVKGDNATVQAELESSGQKRPQVFKLKKEDGDFKLASASQ